MVEEGATHRVPCAALQVLGGRVGELERRLDEHNRIQNANLRSIAQKLDNLNESLGAGREERAKQVGEIQTDVVERFNRVLLAAIGFGVPVLAGLLYLILKQALKTP